MYEELTIQQEQKMQKLIGKYTFNDLRIFLKQYKLQLVIGNNSDILDCDLFKYNFAPKRYYAVYDERTYNSVLYSLEMLDNLKHKRYLNEVPADSINKAKQVVEGFAKFVGESVKDLLKYYEKSQELFDYVKMYSTYQCTFDADKFQILREKGEPDTVIVESTTEWQKYLSQLDAKKQAEKGIEL